MTAKQSTRNINHLRELLFVQLEKLADPEQSIDLDRARLANETARLIVDTARVEVAHAAVIQGALTLPFIENQEGSAERPHPSSRHLPPAAPAPEMSAVERALHGGPPAGHPWRGNSRVHKLEH